jgi:hypothetical protein
MKLLLFLALTALPFPPPRALPVTDRTKCDWGPVSSVSAAGTELVIATPAGPVTYRAGPEVQVYGADGKVLGAVTVLKPGQNVRVYYVVENGAKAQEVDLQTPTPTP